MPSARQAGRAAGRQPKYAAIAADLEARIRSGQYAAGTPLPAQRALSAEYGVTLMTLRQALGVLADRGLVMLRAGKDTLVSPPRAAYRLDTLRSLADDLRDQGHEVATEVVGARLAQPPKWAAEHLGDATALRLERVRRLDGQPAVHQISWVREPYGSAVRGRDFTAVSLYGALADAGAEVASATETIRPTLLAPRVAALLGQPADAPAMTSLRVTYGTDATAMIVDRASIAGTTMEIRAERSTTGIALRWSNAASA